MESSYSVVKRIIETVFLYALIINVCTVTPAKAQSEENSILWEVSGNGLDNTSYIFGIINFLPAKEFKISQNIRNAIGQSKVFITKTPITRSSRNEFSRAARIPNDGWINDYLTDDELNQLRLLMLKDLEVSEHDYHFTYSRFQPIILVTATTLLSLGKNVVFVENVLAKVARKKRLKFTNLNSIEEEIAAFNDFPIPDQVEVLKYTVNNYDAHINDYNQLVNHYRYDQDLQWIHEEILKKTNRSEKFQNAYYIKRNDSWAIKIDQIIKQNPAFVAIGAAHLYGEKGLIHLLSNAGYTMKPIKAFD